MSVVLKPYDEDLIEMRWYQSDLVIANGEVAFGIIGSAIRKNHILMTVQDQKEALLNELETVQAVRRGTSDGKIGPYDRYVYRFSFENQQEISMDDRGTLYTQRGGYTMTGDISGVLDLLNGWF